MDTGVPWELRCRRRHERSIWEGGDRQMLLYDNAVSGNCYKVRLLLAQLAIPYERRELSVADRSNRPQVLGGLNPALRVPTVVLDDGRALAESNAILWYFGEGTRYVPQDRYERAQVLQWQFFEQYDHEPHVAVARFWVHYRGGSVDPAALAQRRGGGLPALDPQARNTPGPAVLGGGRDSPPATSPFASTPPA